MHTEFKESNRRLLSKNQHIDISIVIPLLNEEASLTELFSTIKHVLLNHNYTFEVIFVDDGSIDQSFQVIKKLAQENEEVKGIRFRRNYGKSTALQKGFESVRGTYVVTMDADLQDDPNEIPGMIELLKEGNDLVSGWKKERHDPISKTIPSRFFNYVTSKVTGIKLHDFNCGLKAYRREVVDSIFLYGEMHRYVPFLAHREGFFRITEKVVKHHPRKYGRSKFGLSRFINGFLDLLSLLFISKFTQRPMHFFGTIGTISLLAGALITIYLTYLKLVFDEYLSKRPLLLFGILFLVLGVQFFSIGLIGELISRNRNDEKVISIKEVI